MYIFTSLAWKKKTKTYMGNLIICIVTNVLDASIFIKGSSFFHFQDLNYLVILLTVCHRNKMMLL